MITIILAVLLISISRSTTRAFGFSFSHADLPFTSQSDRGFAPDINSTLNTPRTATVRINAGGQTPLDEEPGPLMTSASFSGTVVHAIISSQSITNQVLRFEGTDVMQQAICDGMVGPLTDGSYYCTDQDHGYCDRRNGACWCNPGYQGKDCSQCAATHFDENAASTNVVSKCAPKLRCPNDCSEHGSCDWATGQCECLNGFFGSDCNSQRCTSYDALCTSCTAQECLQCDNGFFVSKETETLNQCVSCTTIDPRCSECSASECFTCTDSLLGSVMRSGSRHIDADTPVEDETREFSQSFMFGSQSASFFDEAEAYVVQSRALSSGDRKVCSQDVNDTGSDAWSCSSVETSHAVCGHAGTISWTAPSYAVREDADSVQVSVRRSGGGFGRIVLSYSTEVLGSQAQREEDATGIPSGIASTSTATATARYTSGRELVFEEGVIELTFRVQIHDDLIGQGDREFKLVLHSLNPEGRASLGVQRTSSVRVLDDDFWRLSPRNSLCVFVSPDTAEENDVINPEGMVDDIINFQIQARTPANEPLERETVEFVVETWMIGMRCDENAFGLPSNIQHLGPGAQCVAVDDQISGHPTVSDTPFRVVIDSLSHRSNLNQLDINGEVSPENMEQSSCTLGSSPDLYNCAFSPTHTTARILDNRLGHTLDTPSTKHVLAVQAAVAGGLLGEYWDDSEMRGLPSLSRVDALISLNWQDGPLSNLGKRMVGVRWSGGIRVPTEYCETDIVIRMSATSRSIGRLWLDHTLVAEHWEETFTFKNASRTTSVSTSTNPAHTLLQSGFVFPCSRTVPIVIHYRFPGNQQHGDGALKLTWATRTNETLTAEAFTVIPRSWLMTLHHVDRSPFPLTIHSALPVAYESEGLGEALTDAVVGTMQRFKVLARDPGANVVIDADPLLFEMEAIESNPVGDARSFTGAVVLHTPEASAGAYMPTTSYATTMTYTAVIATAFDLHVRVQGVDILGSPFPLIIKPAVIDGNTCVLSGSGLSLARAGVEATFQLIAKDFANNIRVSDDDVIEAFLLSSQGLRIDATVTQVVNGVYDLAYTVVESGAHNLYVLVGDACRSNQDDSDALDRAGECAPVANSPFVVSVAYTTASGQQTLTQGPGLTASTSGAPATFEVTVRDEWANSVVGSGDSGGLSIVGIEVSLHHIDGSVQDFGACVDNGGGEYTCTYIPTLMAGQGTDLNGLPNFAQLFVELVMIDTNNGNVEIREQVVGSPFDLVVADGSCDATMSEVSGFGSTQAIAGEKAVFYIQARDAAGNELTSPRDCVFSADLPSASTIDPPTVEYTTDGIFMVTYVPRVAGTSVLNVLHNGVDSVMDPAGSVVTAPGKLSAINSTISGDGVLGGTIAELAVVQVQARDAFGNNRTGIDDLFWGDWVSWRGPNGDLLTINDDEGDDLSTSYYVPATALGEGLYDLSLVPDVASLTGFHLVVSALQPGGIMAEYFSNQGHDSKNLVRSQIDSALDFLWPENDNQASPMGSAAIAADRWSATWSGYFALDTVNAKLEPPLPSPRVLVNLHAIIQGGVRVWLDHQLVLDQWPVASASEYTVIGGVSNINSSINQGIKLSAPSFGTLAAGLVPEQLYHIRVDFEKAVNVNEATELQLSYSTAQDPDTRVLIDSTHLWHTVRVNMSPYRVYYDSAVALGSASNLHDIQNSLTGWRSGFPVTVAVDVRDQHGNTKRDCADNVVLSAWLVERVECEKDSDASAVPDMFQTSVTCVSDNDPYQHVSTTHILHITPMVAGSFFVHVAVNLDMPDAALGMTVTRSTLVVSGVQSSPFLVNVVSGITNPSNSIVNAPGFRNDLSFSIAGITQAVTITARDTQTNVQLASVEKLDRFWVVAEFQDDGGVDDITFDWDNYDVDSSYGATHTVDVVLMRAGNYTLHVYGQSGETDGGAAAELALSPFSVVVEPAPMNAALSSVDGILSPGVVELSVRDEFGNMRTHGTDGVFVNLRGELPENAQTVSGLASRLPYGAITSITDRFDGTYLVNIEPEYIGTYELDAWLASPGGLKGEYWTHDQFRNTEASMLPVLSRVDSAVSFELIGSQVYGSDSVLPNPDNGKVGARWVGYIEPEFNGEYTIRVVHASSAEVRLNVAGVEAMSSEGVTETVLMFEASAGTLFPVELEVSALTGKSEVDLRWSTALGVSELVDELVSGTVAVEYESTAVNVENLGLVLLVGDEINIETERFIVSRVEPAAQLAYLDRQYPLTSSTTATVARRAREETIASHRMFYEANPISGSPFPMTFT